MFKKIFKKKEVVKMFRVTKWYNIWAEEWEEVDFIMDEKGLSNLVVNGYEDLEYEEVK